MKGRPAKEIEKNSHNCRRKTESDKYPKYLKKKKVHLKKKGSGYTIERCQDELAGDPFKIFMEEYSRRVNEARNEHDCPASLSFTVNLVVPGQGMESRKSLLSVFSFS